MDMNRKKRCTAIVLSAGQGKRMGAGVQKQYIELEGKPVIYYTLKAFQESEVIDDVIMVVGVGDVDYARNEIVNAYGFSKVTSIVEGGKERYDSVWCGLQEFSRRKALSSMAGKCSDMEEYVFVHDGARLFVDDEILRKGYETVEKYKACVAGVPSKDTIKLVDDECFAATTPQRKYVWAVQTPQIFEASLIIEAYSRLMQTSCEGVTDDAMVVERMMKVPVKLFEASYENIKLTTPEDLEIAKVFLEKRK